MPLPSSFLASTTRSA